MYLQFYQLRQAPFQAGADAAFFWKGKRYLQALRVLQQAVEHGGGVSLLTGDVGTGKTTVVHGLLRRLGKDVTACLISDPSLTIPDFYQLVLHAFRIRRAVTSRSVFHRHMHGLLQKSAHRHRKVLLIIDEAQRLPPELTAELAEMAKIFSAPGGTLHLCLVGQTDAGRRSLAPVIGALTKYISADYHIAPLDPAETAGYVRHRLRVAGADREIFSEEALAEVFRHSGGFPIQVNLICDFSLFSGFAERTPVITEDIVRWGAETLRLPDIIEEPTGGETEEEDFSEDYAYYEISQESGVDEAYAPEAGDAIEPDVAPSSAADDEMIEPDAGEPPPVDDAPAAVPPEKAVKHTAPRKPAVPSEKPGFSSVPRRRSLLTPALGAAVLLLVAGGGYLFYSLEYGSPPSLLNRLLPGIAATADAPTEVPPEPVIPPVASDAEPPVAPVEQTAAGQVHEPAAPSVAVQEPDVPAVKDSEPLHSPLPKATPPAPAAESAGSSTESAAVSEERETQRAAAILPSAPPVAPESAQASTTPAMTAEPASAAERIADETVPATAETATAPSAPETLPTVPAAPEKPVPPAIAPTVGVPAPSPPAPTDARASAEARKEPSPSPPATPGEPDPSAVINWLLKKKGK